MKVKAFITTVPDRIKFTEKTTEYFYVDFLGFNKLDVVDVKVEAYHKSLKVYFSNPSSVVSSDYLDVDEFDENYIYVGIGSLYEWDKLHIEVTFNKDYDGGKGYQYFGFGLNDWDGVSESERNRLISILDKYTIEKFGQTVREVLQPGIDKEKKSQEDYDREFVTVEGDYPEYIIDEAQEILDNLNLVGSAVEVGRNDLSVQVKDTSSGMKFWIDFWITNGDLDWDWNQYMFTLTDDDDLIRKALQENGAFTESAWSTAEEYALGTGDLVYDDETDSYKISNDDDLVSL